LITPRVNILGYPVDNLTMDQTVQKIDQFIASGEPHQVTVINANKIYLADRHPTLWGILQTSDLVIPEQAILIAGNLLKRHLRERVSGVELMGRLLEEAPAKGYRIFLLGAKPEVVKRLVEICHEKYRGINIVGYSDGYFDEDSEVMVLKRIQKAKPDILFVALGSPKQELWIKRNYRTLGVPFCIGVGGSFDVHAGFKKSAPDWMRCGLEWIYRMMQDKKLWKRYFITNTFLIGRVLRARLTTE
jgi:N-acetylglucosaminyldiphosphoundecaprenol N-acetyl-beta-D-mannosaminyltransferase